MDVVRKQIHWKEAQPMPLCYKPDLMAVRSKAQQNNDTQIMSTAHVLFQPKVLVKKLGAVGFIWIFCVSIKTVYLVFKICQELMHVFGRKPCYLSSITPKDLLLFISSL